MAIRFSRHALSWVYCCLLTLFAAPVARADDAADLATKLGFKLIRIPHQGQQLSFLVAGTPEQLRQRKPVIVLCQGSEVRPLFVQYPQGPHFVGWSMDLKPYQDRYHFVIVSKPSLPLVAPLSALSPSLDYMDPVTHEVPDAFVAHDTPQQYAADAEAVLRYLRRQPWVDPANTTAIGFSQGYHTAVRLAALDRHVTHAALLSSNPYSRLHQYVSDARAAQYRGELTPVRAQGQIDSLYLEYRDMMRGTEAAARPWVRQHWRNWIAVTKYATVDTMLQLRIPLFVGYGTADIGSASNDVLPFEFARRGKTNLTLHAYPGLDHHLAITRLGPNGKPQEPEWHDDDVLKDVMAWLAAPTANARQ